MATVYSRRTGEPIEVPDTVFSDLQAFEASERSVFADLSSEPIDWRHTHAGMMRLGEGAFRVRHAEAAEEAARQAEEDRLKQEIPSLDPSPGADWSGLVN